MIKRILCPLDPSEYTERATDFACNIAKYHDAEVTGLVVLDVPGIESGRAVPLGASYYVRKLHDSQKKQAEKRITELLDAFKAKCEAIGVKHSGHMAQGVPSEKILKYANYFDVVIMGKRTYFHFQTQDTPGDSFEEVLESSITPVIAVPKQFTYPPVNGKPLNAMVCLDGEAQSLRALQRFAHLSFNKIMNVHIVVSHEDKTQANFILDEAERVLIAHGTTNIKKVHTTRDIIDIVDSEYMDWASFFVIGAHNKGFFDFLLGSFSKYIINNSKVPIFIGQ